MPKRCFRNPLKTNKNKAKPKKKVLGERMRKSRAPAGFKNKPLLGALPLSEGSADMSIQISWMRLNLVLDFGRVGEAVAFLLGRCPGISSA